MVECNLLTRVEAVRRTWKERVFTRPWRPWRKIKHVTGPDPDMMRVNGMYYGHPATVAKLRKVLDQKTNKPEHHAAGTGNHETTEQKGGET